MELVQRKRDVNYIKIFLTAFLVFTICVTPSIISSHGIWIFYGDFNVQQIPFYVHVQRAVREGRLLYDWNTDLGGSFLGCYSFYLLGSPFFWLSCLFKTEVVPYLMPWLTALKYAVMATTAYAYMKRHVNSPDFAFVSALLYTFSGFQGAVLVYNHFHDVMAFFPLYLILFENLISKKKVLPFTLMTTFMLCLNYYFFVGEAVFLVLYYVAYYACERGSVKEKLHALLRAFFAGLSGVLLSGAYILPAVYYTLGNSRVSDTLLGYDLVAYKEPTLLLGILKNVVMLSDVSGLNSMFNQSFSRVSGIGGYLPMFSISGVIAFFLYNKEKNKEKRLLLLCLLFAIVPVLNSLFSAMNSEYYARWYFMPVLIMALVTGKVLENREAMQTSLKKGANVVVAVTILFALMSVLPSKNSAGELTVLGALKNVDQLIVQMIFSGLMLLCLHLYIRFWSKAGDRVTKRVVVMACLATTATMFATGTFLVDMDRKEDFITQAVRGESPVETREEFYRVETDEDFYNYPMLWENTHSVTSFISTIPASTLDFYKNLDVSRKVTSNIPASRPGLRTLLSSKYYLTNTMNSIEFIGHIENMEDLKGYSLKNTRNGFKIYENENFVPMGFSFDEYILESEYRESELSTASKDRLLLGALIVPDDMEESVKGFASHCDVESFQKISINTFKKYCDARRAEACDLFVTSKDGFNAHVTLPKNRLLFFSVPYEDGFSAYVDGEETEIMKVDYGMMAVKVQKGSHDIEFKYKLSLQKEGVLLSWSGIAVCALTMAAAFIYNKKKQPPVEIEACEEI